MIQGETVIERYVTDVLSRLPAAVPQREAVARDLRANLEEVAAASGSAGEAVDEMGPAGEVASGYAESLDLSSAAVTDRVGAFLVDLESSSWSPWERRS